MHGLNGLQSHWLQSHGVYGLQLHSVNGLQSHGVNGLQSHGVIWLQSHGVNGLQSHGVNCTVFLVYLQVTWCEDDEHSTHSQRSHASLQLRSLNCAVQYLRGFRPSPGISPAVEFN